ncbi:hypothetical protein T06_2406 [Trichinella sp. T6]|nr:hypothetical protein T06_2406 [Trichinella sp. T6]
MIDRPFQQRDEQKELDWISNKKKLNWLQNLSGAWMEHLKLFLNGTSSCSPFIGSVKGLSFSHKPSFATLRPPSSLQCRDRFRGSTYKAATFISAKQFCRRWQILDCGQGTFMKRKQRKRSKCSWQQHFCCFLKYLMSWICLAQMLRAY